MFFERCVETDAEREERKIKIRIPHSQFNLVHKIILESETELTCSLTNPPQRDGKANLNPYTYHSSLSLSLNTHN